ncbi:MAG: hypothetical protein IJK39_02820, partial [Bacteroidales bacterium]|nr:hypothetical protein [Bacteroidales bacterium]
PVTFATFNVIFPATFKRAVRFSMKHQAQKENFSKEFTAPKERFSKIPIFIQQKIQAFSLFPHPVSTLREQQRPTKAENTALKSMLMFSAISRKVALSVIPPNYVAWAYLQFRG